MALFSHWALCVHKYIFYICLLYIYVHLYIFFYTMYIIIYLYCSQCSLEGMQSTFRHLNVTFLLFTQVCSILWLFSFVGSITLFLFHTQVNQILRCFRKPSDVFNSKSKLSNLRSTLFIFNACLGLIKCYHFCSRSTISLSYWWYFGGCWWYIGAIMILVLQKYRKSHR